MPFFPELAQIMGDDTKVALYLEKDGKNLVANVVWTSGEHQMPSFTASGTPKEFEAQLIPRCRKFAARVQKFRDSVDTAIEKLADLEKTTVEKAKQDAGRVSVTRTSATNRSGPKGSQVTIA